MTKKQLLLLKYQDKMYEMMTVNISFTKITEWLNARAMKTNLKTKVSRQSVFNHLTKLKEKRENNGN